MDMLGNEPLIMIYIGIGLGIKVKVVMLFAVKNNFQKIL